MHEEYAALIANYTWTLLSPLSNVDVVGPTLMFLTKDVNGVQFMIQTQFTHLQF